MSEEYNNMSDAEKKKEDWMNSKWRPMMGWLYMGVCAFDFVLFPILWSLVQTLSHQSLTQWQPLTLQGAGLFHIAMGAVLGIAALGRTQEKMAGANNGGISTPAAQPAAFSVPTAVPATPTAFVPPAVAAPKPFVPAATPAAGPVVASNGKLGPAPAAEPEL